MKFICAYHKLTENGATLTIGVDATGHVCIISSHDRISHLCAVLSPGDAHKVGHELMELARQADTMRDEAAAAEP